MTAEKTDRRVRKTKALLRKTLISLLMEKKLNNITVMELCTKADINRGTFYLHYKDIFELYNQIESDVFNELMDTVKSINACDTNLYITNLRDTLRDMFSYLGDNHDFCTVIFGDNRSREFINNFLSLSEDYCVSNWMRMYSVTDRSRVEAFYHYTASGCVGLLRRWLDSGRVETPDELAAITESFILKGIEAFKE